MRLKKVAHEKPTCTQDTSVLHMPDIPSWKEDYVCWETQPNLVLHLHTTLNMEEHAVRHAVVSTSFSWTFALGGSTAVMCWRAAFSLAGPCPQTTTSTSAVVANTCIRAPWSVVRMSSVLTCNTPHSLKAPCTASSWYGLPHRPVLSLPHTTECRLSA